MNGPGEGPGTNWYIFRSNQKDELDVAGPLPLFALAPFLSADKYNAMVARDALKVTQLHRDGKDLQSCLKASDKLIDATADVLRSIKSTPEEAAAYDAYQACLWKYNGDITMPECYKLAVKAREIASRP